MRATSLQPKLPRVPLAKQGRVAQQRCGLHGCRENSQEQLLEAVGLCLPHAALANLLSLSQSVSVPTCAHRPPTGEPDAGNPPVRLGGRDGLRAIPTPIQAPATAAIMRIAPVAQLTMASRLVI